MLLHFDFAFRFIFWDGAFGALRNFLRTFWTSFSQSFLRAFPALRARFLLFYLQSDAVLSSVFSIAFALDLGLVHPFVDDLHTLLWPSDG